MAEHSKLPSLKRFFDPCSLAVIGASDDKTTIRGRIVASIVEGGFAGELYPVSRSKDSVFGVRCFKRVTDLPQTPDLAIVVVPADVVMEVLRDCVGFGITRVLILSSGFAEQRDPVGRQRTSDLNQLIAATGLLVCGPNAEGFYNKGARLSATFSPAVDDLTSHAELQGPTVAVVSQSGGIGFAAMDRGAVKNLPVSHVVSVGNEAGLQVTHIMEYLLQEPNVGTVMLFAEGIKDGAAFRKVARQAQTLGKPLVVLKTGRTEAAMKASLSHTANLAGSYESFAAVCRAHAVTLVQDIDEWVDVSHGFVRFAGRPVAGKRVAIMTASGGGGVLVADLCGSHGLDVATLDQPTRDTLQSMMPAYGSADNPVDITAQGVFTFGYSGPLKVLLASPSVDMVIVVLSAIRASMVTKDIEALSEINRQADKPVMFCCYTTVHPDVVSKLTAAGFPVTNNMSAACRTLAAWVDFSVGTTKQDAHEAAANCIPSPDLLNDLCCAPTVVCEYRAMNLLADYGIAMAPRVLVNDEQQALDALVELGGPVALKLQSSALAHRSDVGGVRLNLADVDAVRVAFHALLKISDDLGIRNETDGVLVQPMAPDGVEMIVGIHRDRDFGLMLLLGLGGVWAEAMADVVLAPIPVNRTQANDMIDQLKGKQILQGLRGQPPADLAALIELLVGISGFAECYAGYVSEIDLNPVIVHSQGQGVSIVDALIVKINGAA